MNIKTTLLAILVAVVLFSSQPTSCVAAGPGRAITFAAIVLQPAACEAGVIEKLCSSLTSFLNDEAAKADADAKACKKSCGWKKRKDDLLDTAKKKAKESCSKGEAPNVQELSKGLDRNTKDRLKTLYDNNSRMFDGTAKLKAVDFNAVSSKDATVTGKTAVLGKGGQVTDLKSAEPATPKLNAASEFSLTSKSPSLLASTKTAGVSTLPLKVVFMKASAAGQDPVVDCEGTIEAWKISNPEMAGYIATCKCSNGPHAAPVCRCPPGQEFNAQWQCVPSGGGGTGTGTWQKLKDKLNSIIKAIREKIDAVWIALWNKFTDNGQKASIGGWVECDGKGAFKIHLTKETLSAPCDQKGCAYKHEASHIADDLREYPDACQGLSAGTTNFLPVLAIVTGFNQKSECDAYLSVEVPCLYGKAAATKACAEQLERIADRKWAWAYKEYQCKRYGYPPEYPLK